MESSAFRFSRPQKIDPNAINFWSVQSATQDHDMEFRFYVAGKNDDGSNTLYGQADSALEALELKKVLSAELGKFLFVRAKQREVTPWSPDSDASLDAVKDYWNEGRATHEVPAHLRPAFRHFCRTHGRSAR